MRRNVLIILARPMQAEKESSAASETRVRLRTQTRQLNPLLVAIGIAVIALGLRVIGIFFGLPYHYHWDEPTLLNRVIRMGGGDLNPHYFWYPSLMMYVGLVVEGMSYLGGHLTGVYNSPDDFAAKYFEDSTGVYAVGRLLVATIGAANVLLTYVVGRRFFSTTVALAGAVLLAVAPIQVASSHFYTTDVPMTFFVLAAYAALWDVYTRGRRRDYALSGCLIGLGIATKYLPALLLVSLLVAHCLGVRRSTGQWRWTVGAYEFSLGVAMAGVAFFLASPFVFLDWHSALHDYSLLSAQKTAQGCIECSPSFIPYLTTALPWSVGAVAYVAAFIGLLSVVWQKPRRRLELALFWSFPILLFMVVGSGRQPLARYLVPLAPFLALAAADAFWRTAKWTARSWRLPPAKAFAPTAFALLAVIPALYVSARYDLYLTEPDPRTAAQVWFMANVPRGTTIAIQPIQDRYFLTAPIMTESQLATVESYIPPKRASLRQTVDEYFRARVVYADVPFVYDVDTLRSEGVRYVILSSAHYHNIDPKIEDPFYAQLAEHGRVAAEFSPRMQIPDSSLYPVYQPTITIYELPPGRN